MTLRNQVTSSKLSRDVWFLVSLFLGFISGVLSWAVIFFNERPDFCWESGCFENALDLFKFPLQCVVAGFALATLRGMVFRSTQTANQADLTKQQNTFKNYLDHKKQFMDMLKGLEEQHGVKFFNKEELYLKIFPFNSPTYFEPVSRQTDSDLSVLDCWRDSYGARINEFNQMRSYLSVDDPKGKLMAKWVGNYISVLLDLHLSLNEYKNVFCVSQKYEDFFHPKAKCFPYDLAELFYKVTDIYKALAFYCLSYETKQKPLVPAISYGREVGLSLDAVINGQ